MARHSFADGKSASATLTNDLLRYCVHVLNARERGIFARCCSVDTGMPLIVLVGSAPNARQQDALLQAPSLSSVFMKA